jgi:hypothetical protein
MLHDQVRFPTGAHATFKPTGSLPGITFPEIKRQGCEAGHSPLSSAQDKNGPTRYGPSKTMGFVGCNIANIDSVNLYSTLFTLVVWGRYASASWTWLILKFDTTPTLMILKHYFGKSVYWVLCTKKNMQIILDMWYQNNTQKRKAWMQP